MEKKLPLFELFIDEHDESGVDYVALVDRPAIESNWIAFSEQKPLKFVSNEERVVFGALMIPDKPIYRVDDENGEYYVTFTADTIKKIRNKFMRNKYTGNTNAQHDPNITFDDVYMIDSFIADETKGISKPQAFADLPDGTWFGGFKVDNDRVWDEFIKGGIFNGFSVEGLFKMKPKNYTKQNNSIFNDVKADIVEAFKKIIKFFDNPEEVEEEVSTEQSFIDAVLMDGTAVKIEPSIELDASILVITPEGDVNAPDGEHELSDGTLVEVQGGKITDIKNKIEEQEMEEKLNELIEALKERDAMFEQITAKLTEIEGKFEAQTAELEETKTKFNELTVKMEEVVETAKAAPAEEPTEKPKSAATKMTMAEKAIAMAEELKKIKKSKI